MFTDALMLPPGAGKLVHLGSLGVRFMLGGDQTGGRFALVEHPLPARSLGAPVHTHHDEDEFSFVLEGEIGLQIGDRVLVAGPGTLVTKPRNVPHAFWNAADAPARTLELMSPAGFETYFAAMAELFASGPPEPARAAAIQQRYHLDMDFSSIPRLSAAHGLGL
jgi:mannose-6-phosphate isomerase-like protein (cupin superfamily)